jgi:hypothetical protein
VTEVLGPTVAVKVGPKAVWVWVSGVWGYVGGIWEERLGRGGGREDVQIGRTALSVQVTSMLPWGQPVPPEMTFVILKEEGGVDAGRGVVEARVTRARRGSVGFMVARVAGDKAVVVSGV